jgi:hypothetical protein
VSNLLPVFVINAVLINGVSSWNGTLHHQQKFFTTEAIPEIQLGHCEQFNVQIMSVC